MVTIIKKGISKEKLIKLVDKLKSRRGINSKKHCGVIKLKEHPLDIQKKLRNEWS